MSYNILVSDITGYKSIAITSFIKRNYDNVRITGIDYRPFSKILHTNSIDDFVLLNRKNNYADLIQEIIIAKKIDLFIPTNSDEMRLLLSNVEIANKNLSYFGSNESFNILNDKLELSKLCQNINIRMPIFSEEYKKINIPFVMKPKISSSSKGIIYVKSKKDIYKIEKVTDHNRYIIQEYVSGIGVGYSVFASNGKIIIGHGHKRLAEHPVSGGSSMYRENYFDARMKEIAKKIILGTKWSGFAMFEFKLTKENKLYLIEVNPRIWGSINQGMVNGVNYFSELIKADIKKDTSHQTDCKTYHSPGIYYSLFSYIMKLNFKPLSYFIANKNINKPDINVFRDPRGWLSSFIRAVL